VDRLAAHGHVQRRPHPEDGRRTQVEVTAAGREEIDALLEPMQTRLAELDAALDDAERDVVRRYLEGVTEALRSVL
jgi:DNA-binding MarR family transcriptional regulator